MTILSDPDRDRLLGALRGLVDAAAAQNRMLEELADMLNAPRTGRRTNHLRVVGEVNDGE
jgi:hypothetical protein